MRTLHELMHFHFAHALELNILVCVTALESRFQKARLNNLKALGFPIRRVITTGHQEGDRSPKADAIEKLRPDADQGTISLLEAVRPDYQTGLVLFQQWISETHDKNRAATEKFRHMKQAEK